MSKKRADQLLVDRGLAETRSRAQAMILAGEVFLQDARIDKAGQLVDDAAEVRIRTSRSRYVSRGGDKLAGALIAHAVDPTGWRCLDVGASTGGFTDCLLQHGAREIVAVDVGYGQLAQRLRDDSRVRVHERTNARTLTPQAIDGAVDLVVVDASFIGLGKLAAGMAACLVPGGMLLALIKPQFEAGAEEARRGHGVIRDAGVRARAIESALDGLRAVGFVVIGTSDCVLPGPKGNVEAFVYATLGERP